MSLWSHYTCIRQHDEKDCGAACLATVAKTYGLEMPITQMRDLAGTDLQGTSAYGLIKAAEKLGFTAKGVKGELEAIYSEFPLPAIAHVVMEGNLLHYVVVHEISKQGIVVADPARGIIKYSEVEFFDIWSGVLILLTPTASFEKGNLKNGVLSRFFALLKPQKRLLTHIFFASMLYTLMGVLGAFYFKFLMDDLVPYGLVNSLHMVSLAMLGLVLFKVLLSAFRSYMLSHLSVRIDLPLILGYYDHVLRLPMNFFGTRKTGEILSRFNDAAHIREAISGVTLTVMIDTLMAFVGGVLLYMSNAELFGIALCMVILYGVIVFAFNGAYKKKNQKLMEDGAQLNAYLYESVSGVDTIKALGAERKASEKTEHLYVSQIKENLGLIKLNYLRNAGTSLVGLAGGIFILWLGAYKVIRGELTLGQLLVFNSLLAYFVEPVSNLINLQPSLQTALVAAERLGEILDLDLEKGLSEQRKIAPENLRADIKIEGLDFRYGTREKVLRAVDMHIPAGSRVAFVGESGSGKTTLAKLLMGYYKPEKGAIYIGGNHLEDVQLECLRRRVAYVSQETFLFSGSVYDNLILGLDTPSMEEVVKACKLAKAHDFINEMPLRYESRLEENGNNLSGGQRQRLAIARALLREPDILILDEATSNLDSVTESAIQETISGLSKDITVIMIAHRLSTIKSCGQIYMFEKGQIIERGSHEQLVYKAGSYAKLWEGVS